MKSALLLDNVRSVYNVGSLFRTANAVGIEKIYLCGITPTPLDKRGKKRSDFAKVALGAEETILWEYCESTRACVEKLHSDGCYIVALEQSDAAVDYKNIHVENKASWVLVVGSEVDGVAQDVLPVCDSIIDIPMLGTKESLNVTIACGIALYRIMGI